MDQPLEKVTAFITRPAPRGVELLLFRHPNAGIQLPAGTVEEDEPHLEAALREAREETVLVELSVVALIGHQDTALPDDRCVVLHRTPIYARPDRASFDWAVFRRGLPCQIHRQADGFTQITYTEWDRYPDPQYVTYEITGWVPTETLCRRLRRYFYHLTATGDTAAEWTVQNDNHLFRPFWAPIDNLPAIVEPQDGWVRYVREELKYRLEVEWSM